MKKIRKSEKNKKKWKSCTAMDASLITTTAAGTSFRQHAETWKNGITKKKSSWTHEWWIEWQSAIKKRNHSMTSTLYHQKLEWKVQNICILKYRWLNINID